MGSLFDRKTLVLADDVTFEEHNIVCNTDVIIADKSYFDYGIITSKRVFIGEHVNATGNIIAKDDIRIDIFSRIAGDIHGEKDIYLGESVKVYGKVSVGKDLDVGENVEIKKGFNAKGWVNIRNPIPMIIYIFIYLLTLLKHSDSKEIEKILGELEKTDTPEEFLISDKFVYIPRESRVTLQEISVKGNCKIGNRCRVLGNGYVKGYIEIGNNTEIYGSLQSNDHIIIGKDTVVHGNIKTDSYVIIDENCCIHGDVTSRYLELSKNSIVTGTINAKDGIRFRNENEPMMKEKLERYKTGIDIYKDILDI